MKSEPLTFFGCRLLYLQREVFDFWRGGKSLQLPCATCAAMPMGSNSVGCGWMVLPMSTASAPISIARAISPNLVARVGADHATAEDLAVAVSLR